MAARARQARPSLGGVAIGRLDSLAADRRRLAAGQQQALAEPLLGPIRGLHRLVVGGKGRGGDFGFQPNETAEIWRLLGSLELLPVSLKIELGEILLDLLPKRKMENGAAGDRLGRRPPRRADAALRSVEHGRARRDGRSMAEAA